MEKKIISREQEKKILWDLMKSDSPELLALYGRRRVGKSFLINEFFEDKGIYFEIIGEKETKTDVELNRFAVELSHKFHDDTKDFNFKNWDEAFYELINGIDMVLNLEISTDTLGKDSNNNSKKKIILFFDELPWLGETKGKANAFLNS